MSIDYILLLIDLYCRAKSSNFWLSPSSESCSDCPLYWITWCESWIGATAVQMVLLQKQLRNKEAINELVSVTSLLEEMMLSVFSENCIHVSNWTVPERSIWTVKGQGLGRKDGGHGVRRCGQALPVSASLCPLYFLVDVFPLTSLAPLYLWKV